MEHALHRRPESQTLGSVEQEERLDRLPSPISALSVLIHFGFWIPIPLCQTTERVPNFDLRSRVGFIFFLLL
jgi:hypothetical protein